MLTRLEVAGFKNLHDVSVDFGPFTCIAGANGVGKSNVFDAIEFLSYLADLSFGEAAQNLRGSNTMRTGDPRDIFAWNGSNSHDATISIAAEMLVPWEVEDDLGGAARSSTTYLRYEIVLGYEGPSEDTLTGRIRLNSEQLTHITKGTAAKRLHFPHSMRFRNAVVNGQRRGGPFLSTERREEVLVVNVHGDGGSFGRPQPRSAERTGRTVLSTVATNDNPTVLAARREMQSWRRLALEPTALRTPDSFSSSRELKSDGSHLAAALYRIAHSSPSGGEPDPEAVYSRIAGRMSDLLGAQVSGIEVERDQVREVFTLYLYEKGGMRLPARALSEGTLRFLALCVLLEDPTFTGLICMEEPENGIHPSNLESMMELVSDLAVDPELPPGPDNPFRQVIVNTHSPGVVQLCDPRDLVLARMVRRSGGADDATSVELSGYEGSWRREYGSTFSKLDALPYLTFPDGIQFELPYEELERIGV